MPSFNNLINAIANESTSRSQALVPEEVFVDENLDKAVQLEDVKARMEFNELLRQNRQERKKYAHHIFTLTCVWTFVIFLIVMASSLKCINGIEYFSFEISDKVLITLITSTTINFFGFFLLVVKYLFHTEPGASLPTSKEKK